MVVAVKSVALTGLAVHEINIEVDTINSIPQITIIGLGDTAISEAKERLRLAIKNSGYSFPSGKVVINLAPADLKKEGTNYDLPIAMGILAQEGYISSSDFKNYALLGELSLDGELRSITGVLPIVSGLKELGFSKVIVPYDNKNEAALVDNIEVYPAKTLKEVINHFSPDSDEKLKRYSIDINKYLENVNFEQYAFDFKDVKGQKKAKKALEIAAAGGHNILMMGTPGSGKTLLSKCFPSILPPLTLSEAIELTKIYSVSGLLQKDNPLINKRPFRTVHHSASAVGIIGGGSNPKPGEITLAHRGVLFLDEMVEFPRSVLEVLRQPLEDGEVTISRAQTSVKYPADFILLGAMNPCPCGYLGDSQKQCVCSDFQITRYRSKLSGPLLDRIDIQIEVPRLSQEELLKIDDEAETSEQIRERVVKARKIQQERYKDLPIFSNSELNPKLIKQFCQLSSDCEMLLKNAIAKFNLSGRSYDRILKLSRTIADLEGVENITVSHIAQALQYRNFVENKE